MKFKLLTGLFFAGFSMGSNVHFEIGIAVLSTYWKLQSKLDNALPIITNDRAIGNVGLYTYKPYRSRS